MYYKLWNIYNNTCDKTFSDCSLDPGTFENANAELVSECLFPISTKIGYSCLLSYLFYKPGSGTLSPALCPRERHFDEASTFPTKASSTDFASSSSFLPTSTLLSIFPFFLVQQQPKLFFSSPSSFRYWVKIPFQRNYIWSGREGKFSRIESSPFKLPVSRASNLQ